jgi:hypothetical protein
MDQETPMPRSTHPEPVRKHPRALVRAHRERVIAKRWSLTKQRYAPGSWPFRLPLGSYTNNPFPPCNCDDCTYSKRFEPRRARGHRELAALVAEVLGTERDTR